LGLHHLVDHRVSGSKGPPFGIGNQNGNPHSVMRESVVALLRKYKQPLESFQVDADVSLTEGKEPTVFKEVRLTFKLKGQLDPEKVLQAITLSQICGYFIYRGVERSIHWIGSR